MSEAERIALRDDVREAFCQFPSCSDWAFTGDFVDFRLFIRMILLGIFTPASASTYRLTTFGAKVRAILLKEPTP